MSQTYDSLTHQIQKLETKLHQLRLQQAHARREEQPDARGRCYDCRQYNRPDSKSHVAQNCPYRIIHYDYSSDDSSDDSSIAAPAPQHESIESNQPESFEQSTIEQDEESEREVDEQSVQGKDATLDEQSEQEEEHTRGSADEHSTKDDSADEQENECQHDNAYEQDLYVICVDCSANWCRTTCGEGSVMSPTVNYLHTYLPSFDGEKSLGWVHCLGHF